MTKMKMQQAQAETPSKKAYPGTKKQLQKESAIK